MEDYLDKQSLQSIVKHFFHQLTDDCINQVIEAGELIQVNAGEIVIKQGADTNDVYFLLFGRITVEIKNEYNEEFILNEISRGEFFGEMSLLTGEPRGTTLITTKESTLLKIKGDTFKKLLDKHPSIHRYLNTLLINRLKKANQLNSKTAFQNICFLQLDESPSVRNLLQSVKEKLSAESNFFFVTKESFSKSNALDINAKNANWTRKHKFINWVYNLNKDYHHIVYFCDEQDQTWTELCLSQADRIMLVGSKVLPGDLTKIEKDLFVRKNIASKIERNLIIAWEEGDTIANTKNILENRPIKNTFHIRTGKEVDRLIRYIMGKSIKLVLGGGGAKGFAHLGVYKAMLELDIPVDFVGGTSVGAIMGGSIAFGWSYEEMKEAVYQALVAKNPLNDYHLPLVSLLKGKKLEYTIQKYFGDRQIEDLVIPYYAIASNFTKSRIEILNDGPLSFAIRASISLPTILPPAVKGNSLLVDGGLIDNLPFEYMASLAQGPIIGVDLSTHKERTLDYDEIPNNFTLLKQKVFGKRKYKVPSLGQIIMGTMTIASEEKRRNNEKKFDVYIKPDVSKYGFLKWNNFETILQIGYDTAFPILQAWKEKHW